MRRATLAVAAAFATTAVAAVTLAAARPAAAQEQPEGQGQPEMPALLQKWTPVTDSLLQNPPDGEWLMWRGSYGHWGYSPLGQIHRGNVDQLRLAWAWTMAPGLQETTPLVHDGVMFLAQACDFVEALDATDGTLLWDYRRERVEHPAALACANRTAALYEDKLFIATHDAHLVALDVHDGSVVWDVEVGNWKIGHHYSGGPMVIEGLVVAGMSGCYHINTGCWISAHDPDTGEEVWRTYTIPPAGEPGSETWGKVPPDRRLGGSAWIAPSYDPELGLIFAGVAVPVPWGSVQRGSGDADLLYTNSTLALDPKTGEIVWYFQHLPGDEWDMDHAFGRIIVETEVAPLPDEVEWINPALVPGERRKVVTGVPGKPGLVWTLDAATGDFLWARTTFYQNVIVGVDVEHRKGIANPEIRHPEIGEEIVVCPHLTGGINWQSVAYSPLTNALYVPGNDVCMRYTLNDVHPPVGAHHDSAERTRIPAPGSDGRVGRFTAVDVRTGRTLWELRQRAGFGGSVLTTAGGLVFATDDARRFRAFDAETGEVLWEQLLNSSAGGFPVSYMVDGVQYVAIAAGGGPNYRALTPEIRQRSGGNTLFVFRLP
ncbi:MAG TPA: PQQ-binding-like beta-propeller repeat protein [Longimicrobiales bacterium]|nr:PQQ-binding-like beta-propeller repeat protein [Longimicrobiales bacterium]